MRIRHLVVTGIFALAAPAAAQVGSTGPAPAPVEEAPAAASPPPAAPKGSPITARYDGGTILSSQDGKFELKLGARLQTRYELVRGTPAGSEDAVVNQRFLVPRTRVNLDGHVFGDRVRFKVEGSFSDSGQARLRDFYLDGVIVPGVVVRAGQFKRPYNRQEIVSDFATEMPEKALTNDLFANGGRDLGVMLHDDFDRSPEGLEWAVGLFNGTGDRAVSRATTTCTATSCTTTVGSPSNAPADFQPQLVARLGVNVGGIKGYSEADLEGGPLRFAASVSYKMLNLQDTDAAPLAHALEIDMLLKTGGLDVQAAGFLQKDKGADTRFAGHVQAGYFLTPKHAQIAARFGATPLPLVAGADQEYLMEVRGGFSYYFFGHALKWSNDIGFTQQTTEGASAELQLRSQAQLIF